MKLYMTKGLPGSGKTTWARDMMKVNDSIKRVNKDDIRAMIGKTRENVVLDIRNDIICQLMKANYSVIVDDTNFNPIHELKLKEIASIFGAEFEIKDLTHVTLEECIANDRKRLGTLGHVGEKVIRDMHKKYLSKYPFQKEALIYPEPPAYNPTLPDCIIVDIDGTVATMNGRGPYDWDKVDTDLPRKEVLKIIKSVKLGSGAEVIFVSGRDGSCRRKTIYWLQSNFDWSPFHLYMREAGDMRRDSVVKREIYDTHIKGHYNVIAIFDDRPQVIRECWYALGYRDRVFNVGDMKEF